MKLISLPGPEDLKQVARWHEHQAKLKKRKGNKRDVERHNRIAAELRNKAYQQ